MNCIKCHTKAVIGLLGENVDYRQIVDRGVRYGTRNRAGGWASGLTILTARNMRRRFEPFLIDGKLYDFHFLGLAFRSCG